MSSPTLCCSVESVEHHTCSVPSCYGYPLPGPTPPVESPVASDGACIDPGPSSSIQGQPHHAAAAVSSPQALLAAWGPEHPPPSPKRQKVQQSSTETVSLLSSDEDEENESRDKGATTSSPKKSSSSKRKRADTQAYSSPSLTVEPSPTFISHPTSSPPPLMTTVWPANEMVTTPTSSPVYRGLAISELQKTLTSNSPVPTSTPTSIPGASGAISPEEPPLCPEQAQIVELIASGRNVFYTGSAGCGKSTVLKAFTKRLQDMGKRVRIVAPTGRAALQVNGSTTWTFAGWTPDHHKRPLHELKQAAHGKFVWKRFTDTDVLVIDEISMVENLHFERLNEVMKEARYNAHASVQPAFGGVQVVVTGDFCQLPPVKPFQHCIDCGSELADQFTDSGKVYVCNKHKCRGQREWRDEDKWAFRSKAWEDCNFVHVHLNTIHRQNDETFIRILQKCRIGEKLSSEDTDLLMNHKTMVQHAVRLFSTRDDVARVNRLEFAKLKSINHIYWCLDDFIWQSERHPHLKWKGIRKSAGPQSTGPLRALEDHRFDECVQIKQGMLVVLLVNLDLKLGLCNGSQGIVCGFEKYDPKKLPKAKGGKDEPENRIFGERAYVKEDYIKRFILDKGASHKAWPVVRFHNGVVRTIYANCSIAELGDEQPYSLLIRTQIPLAPAWAMTIHKSQSLTLERVIVDLSKAFEEGQVYVALSRATGLLGLKIEGDSAGLLAGLGGNKEVQKFLREKFGGLNGMTSSAP